MIYSSSCPFPFHSPSTTYYRSPLPRYIHTCIPITDRCQYRQKTDSVLNSYLHKAGIRTPDGNKSFYRMILLKLNQLSTTQGQVGRQSLSSRTQDCFEDNIQQHVNPATRRCFRRPQEVLAPTPTACRRCRKPVLGFTF